MELFNTQVAVENLGPLLAGLLITIELTFVVIVLSLVFALLVALGGMSRWLLLRWLIKAYIELMRGTPLLLQLIYIYYVLPEIGIRLDAFTAGVIGLTLNYSAYISEVYRGGILAVPKGQHDAAAALGMTRALAMRRIVLPQAIRMTLPPLASNFVQLIKFSSLGAVISVSEITRRGMELSASTFRPLEIFTFIAVVYFVICWPLAMGIRLWERRLQAR